jgi:ribosomal protein S12 methylthiotransferase
VFLSGGEARAGEMRRVVVSQASDYDLVGELADAGGGPRPKRENNRVSLRVIGSHEHGS